MELYADLGERGHALREDSVVEDHERMLHNRAGIAERLDEFQLAAEEATRCQDAKGTKKKPDFRL